jgi:hypothetical protein
MRIFSNGMKTAAVAALFGIGLAATPALAHDDYYNSNGYDNGYARCGDNDEYCRREYGDRYSRYDRRHDRGNHYGWSNGYRRNSYDRDNRYWRDRRENRDCDGDDCRWSRDD